MKLACKCHVCYHKVIVTVQYAGIFVLRGLGWPGLQAKNGLDVFFPLVDGKIAPAPAVSIIPGKQKQSEPSR